VFVELRRAQRAVKAAKTSVVAFYIAGSADVTEAVETSAALGAVVFRGFNQRKAACAASAIAEYLWLDPADYERPHPKANQGLLFSTDPWADLQRSVGVKERLSPGVMVNLDRPGALDAAIESQAAWVDANGGGRISLALPARWLSRHRDELCDRLRQAGQPFAVAFAAGYDPLDTRRGVEGLAQIAQAVDDLMVLRCDMGALGAMANGARVVSIGTGTSVRHIPTRTGGGPAQPAVFIPAVLDYCAGKTIAGLPSRVRPRCPLSCCNGASLDRYWLTNDSRGLRRHNVEAIALLSRDLLGVQFDQRAQVWRSMCEEAVIEANRIELDGGRPFRVRPQIRWWSQI